MRQIFIVAALMATSPALAQPWNGSGGPPIVKGADVGLNVERYAGKRIIVEDCILFSARLNGAVCPIFVGAGVGGSFNVQFSAQDSAGRKRAISECSELKPVERCAAKVMGTVRKSRLGDVVGLDNAVIYWVRP